MTVLLSRAYGGYSAGQTVQVPTSLENAIVASGSGAVVSSAASAAVTTGPLTTNLPAGRCTIPPGAGSVVVTNPAVDVNSKIFAVINQATPDTSLLRIERIVPAAGSFTIFGTTSATAAISVDWALLGPFGGLTATL
jgi:hypothetical protein